MFDRCWRWRRDLTRHAEDKLTSAQRDRLKDHLVVCGHCRRLAEADVILHDELNARSFVLEQNKARVFDNRVVAAAVPGGRDAVRRVSLSALAAVWEQARYRWKNASFSFLTQLAGGAVVAASLTLLFLVSSLHFGSSARRHSASTAEILARRNAKQPDLPVPMESLLQTPTPRAALLWTTPRAASHGNAPESVVPAPSVLPRRSPSPAKSGSHSLPPASGDATLPTGHVLG